MAAPIGNRNAAKGKQWELALRKALAHADGSLHRIANKVVAAAEEGDRWAIDHIAERLDGKPTQQVEQRVTHVDASRLDDGLLANIASAGSEGTAEASGDPAQSDGLVH